MQPNNRSSFIPKKTIKRGERVRKSSQIYILSYVAYAVFFATLIAVAFVFFYSNLLENKLAEKIAELDAQRVVFNQGDIQRIKEVERRLNIAEYFFNNHASPYKILNEIETYAVEGVVFKTFSYVRTLEGLIELTVSGASAKFDGVAFQSGLFQGATVFQSADFSSINKAGEFSINQTTSPNRNNNNNIQNQIDPNIAKLPVGFVLENTFEVGKIPFSIGTYEVVAVPPPVTDSFSIVEGDDAGGEGAPEDAVVIEQEI